MALLEVSFFSESLGMSTAMKVILPQTARGQIGMTGKEKEGGPATLYLLHGLSDDHSIWCRRTSIERYAAAKGLAVVMPGVSRSFYADMDSGYKYWTFVSEELPELVERFFRIRSDRESTFVAGLSMGGYGAFKLALAQPYRFAAAASLSGALDIGGALTEPDEDLSRRSYRDLQLAFGADVPFAETENDLMHLASCVKPDECPRLFQCCGTEDFLYRQNQAFRARAEKLKLPLPYEEGPGSHSWDYWDAMIQKVLDWLPL